MPNIATVARGALDRFILDLVEAGFETKGGTWWRGPLDPSLTELTDATTMTLVIQSGWPYRHPHLFVEGLRPSAHLNETGLCLWRVGDDSLAWMRLTDLRERIRQWADRYRGRATTDDPVLDPHLYWKPYNRAVLATVDLSKVRWGDGGSGDLTAKDDGNKVEIGESGGLKVRWYGRESMRMPPVNLAMLIDGLKSEQARNLERELERVGQPGGVDVLMVIWGTPVGVPNVLVLRLKRNEESEVVGEAMEVARTDVEVLILRAGPDAPTLRSKSVVIIGQGAIGSHVSLLLARSGLGNCAIYDGARLRPGDIVRHAGLEVSVGNPKVNAVSLAVFMAAPWTDVRKVDESSWDPDALAKAAAGADLVIDAVGEASFTDQLSRRLVGEAAPFLSVALYRGGAVARIRLHVHGGTPFHERPASGAFPTIPPGPLEAAPSWETGCASPVNNAPPAAVVSASALATRIAVDVLMGRDAGNFDIIEVYRALEAEPVDVVGYRRYAE